MKTNERLNQPRNISREEIRNHTIETNQRKNVYEIYICGGPNMVSGWEIKWVFATPEGIKSFPNFDCIITKNDMPYHTVKIINWV